jgi:conjugative transfer signal peptidase TraF
MTSRLSILMTMLAGATLVMGAGILNPQPRFIWNASESVPTGLYALRPVDRWYVTELVAVRPPDALAAYLASNGYLPLGLPILKRILALPGQTVCRNGLLIVVDDVEVGAAQKSDSKGRPLPDWQGCMIVGDGQVFLMNWQSETSLDGRYFGLVAKANVIGRAVPLWTEESR